MPKRSRNEIKAGLFIVLAFVLLVAAIVVIADFESFMRKKQTHYFSFDQVQGLKVNHEVRYAGIKCGRVTGIEQHPVVDDRELGTARTRVLVTVEIDGKVPITDRDKPVVSKGFTGNVYMDIIPYERCRPDEELGKPLVTSREKPYPGYHYPTMDEMFEKASGVVDQVSGVLDLADNSLKNIYAATVDVRDITDRVRGFVERNESKFDTIVENVNRATKNVDDMTGKMKPEVMAAIKDARSLIADARAEVKKLLPRLDPMLKKVEAAVDNVQTASANIVTASADVKRTTAEVKEMVLANRPHIDGMLEESHQAAARLNLGMEDIRRNPWKLLTRNIEADAYTQNIYDATMRFAEGAHSLSVASETLHALQAQPGASDEALARAKKHVKALAEKMPQLEAALFEALQKRPR